MRPPVLLALSLAVLSTQCLANTSAPVTSVVLYPGSATIVRTAQIAAGATELAIDGLPANFRADTLRVQAGPGIRIGEVVTRDAAGDRALNPAEASLAARIEDLKDQQAQLDAEAKSATIVKGYLERLNGGAASDKAGVGPDPRQLAALINTLAHGASETLQKIEKVAVQKRELGKKIDVLERDLARLHSGARDTRAVTVRLAGGTGGRVSVSYQIDNAGWKPGYRAGLDSTASTVELERLATIAQNTGEDWSNVRLTLSTSQPRQSPVGSEAQPWLLSWQAPQPVNDTLFQRASAAPESNAIQRFEAVGSSVKEVAYAEIQGTFASEFEVPGRVSLASDGREVTVTLSALTLAVRQQLQVTPRLENFATIMADAARPEGVWPAGNIQLFRDGNYIGAVPWGLQDGQRVKFAFGRDELLQVSLAAVKEMEGSKGVFANRSTRNSADVFTLVNRHKSAMDVIVLDSSPVSTSEQIKVQARFSPKPSVDMWEQRRGVMAWNRKMAPGETVKINVEYKIEFPKEGQLLGLR